MTLVTLKGILRHRLPLNETPILSHREFGSPLNVDDGPASEECASASASIFAPPPKQRQTRMRWQRY
jgi:hypothetical protein